MNRWSALAEPKEVLWWGREGRVRWSMVETEVGVLARDALAVAVADEERSGRLRNGRKLSFESTPATPATGWPFCKFGL